MQVDQTLYVYIADATKRFSGQNLVGKFCSWECVGSYSKTMHAYEKREEGSPSRKERHEMPGV